MRITQNKIFNLIIIFLIFYIPLLIFFNWDVLENIIKGTGHKSFVFINQKMNILLMPLVIVFYSMSLKNNKDTIQ